MHLNSIWLFNLIYYYCIPFRRSIFHVWNMILLVILYAMSKCNSDIYFVNLRVLYVAYIKITNSISRDLSRIIDCLKCALSEIWIYLCHIRSYISMPRYWDCRSSRFGFHYLCWGQSSRLVKTHLIGSDIIYSQHSVSNQRTCPMTGKTIAEVDEDRVELGFQHRTVLGELRNSPLPSERVRDDLGSSPATFLSRIRPSSAISAVVRPSRNPLRRRTGDDRGTSGQSTERARPNVRSDEVVLWGHVRGFMTVIDEKRYSFG